MQNVGKSRSGNKAIQYQVGLKEGRSQLACLLVVAYCFRLGIAILLAAALVLVFCVRAGGVGVLSEDCSVGSATDAQNSVSLPSPDSRSMAQSCLKTHESLIHFVVLELALLQALFVPVARKHQGAGECKMVRHSQKKQHTFMKMQLFGGGGKRRQRKHQMNGDLRSKIAKFRLLYLWKLGLLL